MDDAVRSQFYALSDGYVLFMASEQKFWRNFCTAVGRPDLFEANPGERLADHARGNVGLRRELGEISGPRQRTSGSAPDWRTMSRSAR